MGLIQRLVLGSVRFQWCYVELCRVFWIDFDPYRPDIGRAVHLQPDEVVDLSSGPVGERLVEFIVVKITVYEQHRLVETAPNFLIVIAALQGVAMNKHDKAAFFGRRGPEKPIGDPAG